jgi:hypothetical protein
MRLNTGHRIASNEQTGRGGLTEAYVRFGSPADICIAKGHVRFSPDSDHESDFSQKPMSALTPKADVCSALVYVG